MHPSRNSTQLHVFSVDVEDYFHVNSFDHLISRDQWDTTPIRIEKGLDRILFLLQTYGHKGTFFVLGWMAQKQPWIIRNIVQQGHEIACHGYWHRRVYQETPASFREDVRSSKRLLEDLSGRAVYGYRAPSFSIISETEWALEILANEGFLYDSSRFPIVRPGYGSPGVKPLPHVVHTEKGDLLELPLMTVKLATLRIPAAGGGWFRLLPYALFRAALTENERQSVSGMFYLHPWELDPDQPRIQVGLLKRFRHYHGLSRTEGRLNELFREFRFSSVEVVHQPLLAKLQGVIGAN